MLEDIKDIINYSNWIIIFICFLSITCNIIVKSLLTKKQSTYSDWLGQVLLIESFSFFNRLLLPDCIYDVLKTKSEALLNIKVFSLLPYLIGFDIFDSDGTHYNYSRFLFNIQISTDDINVLLNIFWIIEMIITNRHPISQVQRRWRIYNMITIIVFISVFTSSWIVLGKMQTRESESKAKWWERPWFYLINNGIAATAYFVIGVISSIYLIIHYCKKSNKRIFKNAYTIIVVIRQILYIILYLFCFFPISFVDDNDSESSNLHFIFQVQHFSTGIVLFAIRIWETNLIWTCWHSNQSTKTLKRALTITKRSSSQRQKRTSTEFQKWQEEKRKDTETKQLTNFLTFNINLELTCCIWFGLTSIFKKNLNKEQEQIKDNLDLYSSKSLISLTHFNQTININGWNSQLIMDRNLGLNKKEFHRIKIHKIIYKQLSCDSSFDINKMEVEVASKDTKWNPSSEINNISYDEFSDECSDTRSISSVSFDYSKNENNATIIEYFPKVFHIMRCKDEITWKMLEKSLNPKNNKSFLDCLIRSKGKSGSFFFFSYDRKFIIKTIKSHELRNMIFDYIPKYFNYLMNNPETWIAKIYGIYTISLNDSTSKVHIIWMQNLIKCPSRHIKQIFDLKGSTFQRYTKNISSTMKNNTIAWKDLDFLWLTKVDKKWIQFTKDAKDKIWAQWENDVQMWTSNNLMDYSLFITIIKFPNENDSDYLDIVGWLGDELYLHRTYKSSNMNYIYIIGLIDYLQSYNLKKWMEYKWKGVFYWKDKKNISVQPPGLYGERFWEFVKNNILI